MLALIVKALLKLGEGVKVKPANQVFTLVIAPLAFHTPVLALKVEVTVPDVDVFNLPAAILESVKVAVIF